MATLDELLTLPLDADVAGRRARAARRTPSSCWQDLKTAPPNSPRMAELDQRLSASCRNWPRRSPNRVSAQIDRELTGAASARRSARSRILFWQTLLLVPMTLAVVGVFTYLFGRPIRAIDRAISELGRGTFSRPIAIRGPADLERLAAQLEWLRGRLVGTRPGKESIPATYVA